MDQLSEAVTLERVGDIVLIRIDSPPVNAASHAVRAGLAAAVGHLDGARAAAL